MRAAVAALALIACSTPSSREICGNGIDDDGNGKIDCEDPDCAGQNGCPAFDAGYFGPCGKCGHACTKQGDCISNNWGDDLPLAQCVAGTCQQFNSLIELPLTLDMSAYAGLNIVGSEATHFVFKTAADGSAVTCASITASFAPDAGPLQIEESGRYSVLAVDFESASVMSSESFPLINLATGEDYLVWIELYGGPHDSNPPHEPTGRRYNPGCYETGSQLGKLTTADECRGADAGCPRAFNFTVPAPM